MKIFIIEKIKIVNKYLLSITFVDILLMEKLETYKIDPIMIKISIRNKRNFLYELFKRLLYFNYLFYKKCYFQIKNLINLLVK